MFVIFQGDGPDLLSPTPLFLMANIHVYMCPLGSDF